jgi:hypothetical protein
VVAVYKNPDPKKPGHIALVMPAEKTNNDLNNEGPTMIQAGRINSSSVSFREGFKHHLINWNPPPVEIVFFYNSNRHN